MESDQKQNASLPTQTPLNAGLPVPQTAVPKSKPVYETTGREWKLLALCLGLGILAADLLLSTGYNWLGLGVFVGVAAWYGALLWYLGPRRLAETRSRLFLTAILLLALTFPLFANSWFRFFNLSALPVLLTVHAFQLSGAARRPWYLPSMLLERFLLLVEGTFGRLAVLGALHTSLKSRGTRRGLMTGAAVMVTVPLVLLAASLLSEADPVFFLLTADVRDFIWSHLDTAVVRLFLGLCMAPFLFSLLYFLGRPKVREEKQKLKVLTVDSVVPLMVLGALDLLYALFVGVQFRALFGGEAYLRAMGLSYAEYARSGFFQLVFITVFNLAVMLTLLQITARTGRSWRVVRVLSTALAALSAVILVSAAWRMTLYVMTYGLSFKRALTYWGMMMMALFLTLACLKIWKEDFSFFKVASVAALVGWLALNYAHVDRLVAEYNVARYQGGSLEQIDLYYLSGLSYDALPALKKLDGGMTMTQWDDRTVAERLAERAQWAAEECSAWETWSLSAWLAAGENSR